MKAFTPFLLLGTQTVPIVAFLSRTPILLQTPRCSSSNLYSTSTKVIIQPVKDDPSSIAKVSSFMMDSFWTPLSQIDDPNGDYSTSSASYTSLTQVVKEDLDSRYGEIMGKRQLNSCLLGAFVETEEDNGLVGMVGVDVTLVDPSESILYTREDAETKLRNTVAALGPKQRREYKNASVCDIVQALLPNLNAVVVLTNLAVSTTQRRMGVGKLLCQEVERLTKEEWEMDALYLRVEAQNGAARGLYESTLGYQEAWVESDAVALRANWESGVFEERTCETLSLVKSL